MLTQEHLDLADWHPGDKEWLKQRKAEWEVIAPKVKNSTWIKAKELPKLKKYFLKGELPQYGDIYSYNHACFFFLLLHPVQTMDNIHRLAMCMNEYQFNEMKRPYFECCNNLITDGSLKIDLSGDNLQYPPFEVIEAEFEFGKEGIFNGNGEIYARLFFRKPFEKAALDKDEQGRWYHMKNTKEVTGGFASSGLRFALYTNLTKKDTPMQFIPDIWLSALPYEWNTGKEGRALKSAKQFLHCVYYYDVLDPFPGQDTKQRRFIEKVRELLSDKENIHPPVYEFWQWLHTDEGRLDKELISSYPNYIIDKLQYVEGAGKISTLAASAATANSFSPVKATSQKKITQPAVAGNGLTVLFKSKLDVAEFNALTELTLDCSNLAEQDGVFSFNADVDSDYQEEVDHIIAELAQHDITSVRCCYMGDDSYAHLISIEGNKQTKVEIDDSLFLHLSGCKPADLSERDKQAKKLGAQAYFTQHYQTWLKGYEGVNSTELERVLRSTIESSLTYK
ncbi:hypothetical protein [Catenovulum sediminis]|uniref:Uncharacterized protein n=1 Tax=Catenovulum sediminis TaxID=1740262 RepID=A0ABV1REA6_9ALTE|nr:hypothetical protein [Catenovulum sediminis]